MQDQDKTKAQLIQEITLLRQQLAEAELAAQTCLAGDTLQQQVQRSTTLESELASSHEQLALEAAEREFAEAALRNAQDQLRAMIEAVPGIVSWIGADLRYLGVNRRLAQNYGLTPEVFVLLRNRCLSLLNCPRHT